MSTSASPAERPPEGLNPEPRQAPVEAPTAPGVDEDGGCSHPHADEPIALKEQRALQVPTSVGGWIAWPLLLLITFYRRFISPLTPPSCRFYPTCSAYGLEALQVHGPLKGTALTVWRILRCQPFGKGGYDPVPPRDQG